MAAASIPTRCITTEAALAVAQGAVARAAALGLRINVAVTDPAGTLMAFLRMNGAFQQSAGIAIDKARTAAGFGFATAEWPRIVGDDALLREGLAQQPHMAMFGGGLPIVEGGERIGAVGVSGGSADQDEACAAAGIAALALT